MALNSLLSPCTYMRSEDLWIHRLAYKIFASSMDPVKSYVLFKKCHLVEILVYLLPALKVSSSAKRHKL